MVPEPQPGLSSASVFSSDVEARLDHAAALCARRDSRLTALRRQVLGLVVEAGAPVGAYDLLDRLKRTHRGAAPPTVYRALEFLLAQGMIHRIERLSAFVSCLAHDHAHAAQFLICGGCGQVKELEDHGVTEALRKAAGRSGFTISGATVEAEGRCAACAAA